MRPEYAGTAQTSYDNLHQLWESKVISWLDAGHILISSIPNASKCIRANGNDYAAHSIPGKIDPRMITVGGDSACRTSWVDVGGVTNDWPVYTANSNQDAPDLAESTGTSFATPAVAGIASLLLDWNPNITGGEIENIITSSAQGGYESSRFGSGMVAAYDALILAEKLSEGALYVATLEALGASGSDRITFSVVQGKTTRSNFLVTNTGKGVLYFEGGASGITMECAFGICLPFPARHMHYTPKSISDSRFYQTSDDDFLITEGYLRPGDSRFVSVDISGVGKSAGETLHGLLTFNVFSERSDSDASYYEYNTRTWPVEINVVADDDCFTTRALRNSPLEPEIGTLRNFRDEFMVNRKNGSDWAAFYKEHGQKIVDGLSNNPSQVVAYRREVKKYLPAIKDKLLIENGLSFLASSDNLAKKLTPNDISQAKQLLAEIAFANPEFAPVADSLLPVADSFEGLTIEAAMEQLLTVNPYSLPL